MASAEQIVDDLRAESDALDGLVAALPDDGWARATPAPGWTIAHQIAHLLWTDEVALTSITDEPGFSDVLAAAAQNPAGFVDEAAEELATLAPAKLLERWRATRAAWRPAGAASRSERSVRWVAGSNRSPTSRRR